MTKFDSFLEYVSSFACGAILLRNFNIYVNKPHKSETRQFQDNVHSAGFNQFAKEPTHISENTLYLVLASPDDNLIKSWEKVYFKSQILAHEYWTILDHFCVPVL